MSKLYFHCGIFKSTQGFPIEVLGSLTATSLEMSTIGRELRVPVDGDRHVFSNNDNVFNGMRVAMHNKLLDVNDVVVFFNHEVDGKEQTTIVEFTQDACARYWPRGFFDQCETDLMELLNWDPAV